MCVSACWGAAGGDVGAERRELFWFGIVNRGGGIRASPFCRIDSAAGWPLVRSMRVSISSPYRPLAIVVVGPLPRRRGAGACGWHRIRECGSAVPSVGAGLGSDGRWVQHGAADLLDDELQVVHVPGDPGGQFRSVAAELPGGVHCQTDREQLLDDVVTSIPLRFPSILWSGSAWFCTTWHRLSTPGGQIELGRAAERVRVGPRAHPAVLRAAM